MPEDDRQDGLRIGKWVPPYRDAAGPLDPPVLRPPMTAVQRVGVIAGLPRAAVATRPRRNLLIAVAVAIVLAGVTVVTLSSSDEAPAATPPTRMVLPFAPAPSPPVSLLPAPSEAASSASLPPPPPSPRGTSPAARRPAPARTSPAATTTAPTPVTLSAGSTVGLGVLGRDGERLRHRGFRARIDRITAGSSAGEKADATFAVRTGLASAGCVSFESVNYPGYFLRHRDFLLRLDRRDRSNLFAQDATFCPVSTRGGTALHLRAVNFPDRALSAGSGSVRLTTSDPIAFVPKTAL